MFFYHCSFLIPYVFLVTFPWLEIPQGPKPPFSFPHPFLPRWMRLNADSLVSRLGSHGDINFFVRAFKLIDNLAAALVCSMIPMSQQKKPHPFASDYTPGQRCGWGSYTLLRGGDFQERDRGRCALNCPLLSPSPSCLVGRAPRAGFHIYPGRGWCL